MKNEKFNQTIDEVIEFVEAAQKLQMDQLKLNIKAVHEANVDIIDIDAVAQRMLDTPVDLKSAIGEGIRISQPAIHLMDEMVCTAEIRVPSGEVGNLNDLSYGNVGSNILHGKEFYHHCSQRGNGLVRLNYINDAEVYVCPICSKEYK